MTASGRAKAAVAAGLALVALVALCSDSDGGFLGWRQEVLEGVGIGGGGGGGQSALLSVSIPGPGHTALAPAAVDVIRPLASQVSDELKSVERGGGGNGGGGDGEGGYKAVLERMRESIGCASPFPARLPLLRTGTPFTSIPKNFTSISNVLHPPSGSVRSNLFSSWGHRGQTACSPHQHGPSSTPQRVGSTRDSLMHQCVMYMSLATPHAGH